MALSKDDFEKLDNRIKQITEQSVEQIDINSNLPPTIDDLHDNNKTYSIIAAILFVDIRKSTLLTETSQQKSMVKIYRSFMRAVVDCVRKSDGVTRQFLGDRIMGVFIDSIDEQGNVIHSAVDKSIEAARSIATAIDFSVNNHLKENVNGKLIECGIGIDYGKVLVTQVGMYGVETDEQKESEINCVWVGNTTNYASKFSDFAKGGEIFISENVYQNLSVSYKNGWENVTKYNDSLLLKGYRIKDYYLDYYELLGNPIKPERENLENQDTCKQLETMVTEFKKLQKELIDREKELAVLQYKLTEENRKLKECLSSEEKLHMKAETNLKNVQNTLKSTRKDFYDFVCTLISSAHCNSNFVKSIKENYWNEIIEKCFEIGESLNISKSETLHKLDCGLISIYSNYKKYDKSFEVILFMAQNNNVWINLEPNTMQWAKENYKLYSLQTVIEKRLVDGTIDETSKAGFEIHLLQIKKIRGV